MSQYHYDEFEVSESERKEQEERRAREDAEHKKRKECKHVNVDPPSGCGYGYCHDCGAVL